MTDALPGWDDVPDAAPATGGKEPRKYAVASLPEFVDLLLEWFPRRPDEPFRWCAYWWEHEEAHQRFKALWDTWEHARLDPVHISAWIRDHADYHLDRLLAMNGPFAECSLSDGVTPHKHVAKATRLPSMPPPPGVFPVYDTE